MAYTTELKVEARLQRTIDANSKPTTTQVTQFIVDIDAELDELLKTRGYDTPITDATELLTMSIISTVGAAWKTEKSCESPRMDLVDELRVEYDGYIKDIKNSNILAKSTGDYLKHPKMQHSSFITDSMVEDKIEDDDDFEFNHDTEF